MHTLHWRELSEAAFDGAGGASFPVPAPAVLLGAWRGDDGTPAAPTASGGSAAAAAHASGSPLLPHLGPKFWTSLRAAPYGFTPGSSVVVTAGALGELLLAALAGGGLALPGAAAAQASPVTVQYTSGVALFDLDGGASSACSTEAASPASAAVWKKTVSLSRLAVLAPLDALAGPPKALHAAAHLLEAASDPVAERTAIQTLLALAFCDVRGGEGGAAPDAVAAALAARAGTPTTAEAVRAAVAGAVKGIERLLRVAGQAAGLALVAAAAARADTPPAAWPPLPVTPEGSVSAAAATAPADVAAAYAASLPAPSMTPGAVDAALRESGWPLTPPGVAALTSSASSSGGSSNGVSWTVSVLPSEKDSAALPSLLVAPPVVAALMMPAKVPRLHPCLTASTGGNALAGTKRPRPEGEETAAAAAAQPPAKRPPPPAGPPVFIGIAPDASTPSFPLDAGVSLAIIVPYRDNPGQNRAEQLARFAAHMPRFLEAASFGGRRLVYYHVFIIEQSSDGFKFNRGKLLNTGFAIASDPARAARAGVPPGAPPFNAFCFHDVDLLPQERLATWYAQPPRRPIHPAAVWSRYAYDTYVGGIITFSRGDFARTNGFPNNFWGWGGEDDDLQSRMSRSGLFPPLRPPPELRGAVEDLEDAMIKEKGGGLRAGVGVSKGGLAEWRNMWKREMVTWQARNGFRDGLATLIYRELGVRALGPRVSVVTVDVLGQLDPFVQRWTDTAVLEMTDERREAYLASRAVEAGPAIAAAAAALGLVQAPDSNGDAPRWQLANTSSSSSGGGGGGAGSVPA